MILTMKRYVILAVIAALYCTATHAQSEILPSRSMTIEGEYNPLMTESGKIMPLPEKTRTVRRPAAVSYLTTPNPFSSLERSPMEVFGLESDRVERKRVDGLIRLGYGLRNVNEGLFDLHWNMTETDYVKLSGMTDGWNTKPDGDWRSQMNNGKIAAEYVHRFYNKMSLGINADLGFSRFNYMPGSRMDSVKMASSSLVQNSKEGSLSVCLSSVTIRDVSFFITGGGEWLIRDGLDLNGTVRSNKEGLIRFSAGVEKSIDKGAIGIGYRQKTALYGWTGLSGCNYQDFSAFTVTPYWNYGNGSLRTSVGLNVDLRTNAGHALLMSPCATLDYIVGSRFSLQLGATGGLEEYDMRTLARISPYWSEQSCITDGYNLVNLYGGLSFNQGSWFSLSAKAGYRHTIDEVFQTRADSLIVVSLLKQQTADVFYARFDADFQFSDRAQVRMDITYSDYLGSYPGRKMELKPAFDANLFGRVKLFKGFDAMLSYRMMAFHRVMGQSMPMVNDLSLTADYDLTDRWSFYATFKHLLGGDFYYYAGYRVHKPSVMLGTSFRF